MTKLEQVIKGLECCNQGVNLSDPECGSCPYVKIGDCEYELRLDALDILKAIRTVSENG